MNNEQDSWFLLLQDFLLLDEVKSDLNHVEKPSTNNECLVDFNQITAKWPVATLDDANYLDDTLSQVSFTVKSDQLMAVVGPVGSGKVLIHYTVQILTRHLFNYFIKLYLHIEFTFERNPRRIVSSQKWNL